MVRFEVYRFTGAIANNEKVALRLRRKIAGAIACGHTVLVDFEYVDQISREFARILLPEMDPAKIKVAGLHPDRKRELGYKAE